MKVVQSVEVIEKRGKEGMEERGERVRGLGWDRSWETKIGECGRLVGKSLGVTCPKARQGERENIKCERTVRDREKERIEREEKREESSKE